MKAVLPFPKPVTLKDPQYLAWIKSLRCLICNGPACDPHHTRPRSVGGSDYRALPLCRKHHQAVGRLGIQTFQKKFNIDFAEEVIRHLETYLSAQLEK